MPKYLTLSVIRPDKYLQHVTATIAPSISEESHSFVTH